MFQLQIEKILKNSNLAITKNRKKVLKVFLQVGKPLGLKTIKSFIANIDRVTLFRILSVFQDCQIIHTIHLDNGGKLYALCNHECAYGETRHTHSHVHFQCEDCLDVSCVSVDTMPSINIPNYIVNNISVNVSGLCANCIL